ncbi:MAG TPA: T9SS type A sorting domain-containing protein, partial [Candidatus Kapabacteria bacterium]
DTFSSDKEKLDTFFYASSGVSLPIAEGFEEDTFPPSDWMLAEAGDAYSPWFQDTVRKSGSFSAGAFNTIFIFDNEGRAEGLETPVFDLTRASKPELSFDLAYNYDLYTPPYTTETLLLTDTLDILISTDCGATFTSLFRNQGAALATFAQPILNPLSVESDFISPSDSNWRHYTIDLSAFAGAPEAFIKFNYISGLGGSIYLDNVAIGTSLAVKAAGKIVACRAFPNPASNTVTFCTQPNSPISLSISDVTGRTLLINSAVTDGAGDYTMDIHTLVPGIYLARMSSMNSTSTMKLTIQK